MFTAFRCFLVLLLFSAAAFAAPPEKIIHLRNERIATPPAAAGREYAADAAQTSGLWIIQFEAAPTPEQRRQLSALGVELVSYIPDDAFIARATKVAPGKIRSLSLVRWFGPFKPEHKIHSLLSDATAREARDCGVNVSVLLAPGAAASGSASAENHFSRVTGKSAFSHGTILRGVIPAGRLRQLAESQDVLWIESAPQMKLNDEIATKIVAGDNNIPGTPAVIHQLGFTGAGVTVAVADSGLDSGDTNSMHADIAGRVKALFYYGGLEDAADEHSHGTHVAGIVAGNGATGEVDDNGYLYGLGVAPEAYLIGQRIFDGVGGYEAPATFETLTREAKRAGADIGSNSWGDDTHGRYDLSAMEFDGLVRDADALMAGDQPYILEFSAGNAGPGQQTVGSPAVGKNVIATGAAQNNRPDLLLYADGPDAMADFSSRGPCEDGRIKPDVTAPGTWISSMRSFYADPNNAWGEISENYIYQGGTSQAGPHVSGAAAVFVQYWRQTHTNATPSPALVKAALINSATDMDETAIGSTMTDENGDPIETGFPQDANPAPNNDEGWGRVDLPNLIGSTKNYQFVDQTALLANSQQFEQRILVGSAAEPLKVTLAYTDVPGSPAAVPALVNDLDLEVLAPDGKVYHGNQFHSGESIPGATAFDTINNVESVHIAAPVPGEYTLRIRARNVVMDARRDTGTIDQDFALVVSGAFAAPGTGIVTFDRRVYSAPASIGLRLVDYDLAGQSTAVVLLRSSTETNGEAITLRASGANGLFTNTVATSSGAAVSNGVLQIQHDDFITAVYQDASPAAQRLFTAQADLLPPVISGVITTNRFGKAQVLWSTDEPASSLLIYGTNTTPASVMTNSLFLTRHTVVPNGQVPGQTNYFKIICADEAGNRSTNNNGGQLFKFIVPFAPPVLVVDAYFNDILDPPPPISNYTAPLTALGVNHDVWDVESQGSPTAADLRAYRVVIWRIAEFSSSVPTGMTSAQQSAVRDYLDSGGALFIASMELISRIGVNSPFVHDVLHVGAFTEDVQETSVEGVPNDSIGDGIAVDLDFTDYTYMGFLELNYSDTITPGSGAEGILTDVESGDFSGLRYPRLGVDSPSRVVFLSFPFDAVPMSAPAPGNRTELLRRILRFLAPGLNGQGNVAFNQSVYAVPVEASVEVADSNLEGLGQITINIASTTQTNNIPLTLTETARRGVFRGAFAIVQTNTGGALPELRAAPGGFIYAKYFDASAGATLTATAPIENTPPLISGVTVEPGYVNATIYWDTDELADSKVEFGESALLGRTALDTLPTDFHAVALPQLEPNRTYYYRIISADRAGNIAVDDNGGTNYTFTTKQPLLPPWSDNMERGATNWTLYTAEESERGWELDVPGALQPAAHSPTNAWGSNLSGDYASQIESYLISPAIHLSGGNSAKLKFWHAHDFTPKSEYDIFEGGELLLLTDDALEPVSLGVYSDVTAGWESVEVDLTPYHGQIVYFAWHYFLFSMDSLPRTGWLVDDVSVTVSNIPTGTLIVSNKLWQSSFTLDGVAHAGRLLVVTNAIAGQHIVVFHAVPFYNTPAAQTNTLAAGTTNIFTGNYTFTDTNTNDISDAWETARFGSVSPARTASTDTDGDGMTDTAEFIAGTNPNDPLPPFRFTAYSVSNGMLHANWNTVPGFSYRVLNTTNLAAWTPLSTWALADGTNMNYSTAMTGGVRHFRAEAANTTGLPASLRLAVTAQTNALRFDWTATTGRAYRLLSSTNLQQWAPVTPWTQTNRFIITPPPAAPRMFRIEVSP